LERRTPDCDSADARLFTNVMDAFRQVLEQAGVVPDLGRHLCSLLREQGDAGPSRSAQIWTGGSPGCRRQRPNIEQLQDRVAEAGRITDAELERFYELIDDPSFSVNSYTLVSARGRRPAG
jgi:hypothetical protein